MSLANGRFLSDLTEDENNPRGPLQRSYSGQKRDTIWTQCDQAINPCVEGLYPNLPSNRCKCIAHDLCKQTTDGNNCIFVGAEYFKKVQERVQFIKEIMDL